MYCCFCSTALPLYKKSFAHFGKLDPCWFFFIDNEELHQGNLKFVKKIITVSENPAIIEKYLYCPDQSVVFLGKTV